MAARSGCGTIQVFILTISPAGTKGRSVNRPEDWHCWPGRGMWWKAQGLKGFNPGTNLGYLYY